MSKSNIADYYIASMVALDKYGILQNKPHSLFAKTRGEAENEVEQMMFDLYPIKDGYRKQRFVLNETSPCVKTINGLEYEQGDNVYVCSLAALARDGEDAHIGQVVIVISSNTEQNAQGDSYKRALNDFPRVDGWSDHSVSKQELLTMT